jgi:hypothetical protein
MAFLVKCVRQPVEVARVERCYVQADDLFGLFEPRRRPSIKPCRLVAAPVFDSGLGLADGAAYDADRSFAVSAFVSGGRLELVTGRAEVFECGLHVRLCRVDVTGHDSDDEDGGEEEHGKH